LSVLLELAEYAEIIEAGLDLAGQGLELAAREVHLRIPEQAVLVGELVGELGLEPVELAAELSAQLPDAVFSRFDLIGFDPRGVGSSTPITCSTSKSKKNKKLRGTH